MGLQPEFQTKVCRKLQLLMSQFLSWFPEPTTDCETDAFKRKTERLVNELKRSAESAEVTLEKIETKADHVLFSSNHIHDSLSSIDIQTQELAQTSKDVEERVVNIVLEHSQTVYKQSL
ncbi:hypothetical protein Hdeb2414_s0975g00970131 [Helianthus debilis subsp. tardiflorus]